MNRTVAVIAAAVLLLATTALAQQEKGTSPKAVQHLNRAPVNREILQIKLPRPTEAKLPNGLTVLLLERHRVPTVNFELWVNTGSLDDPKDLPGWPNLPRTCCAKAQPAATARSCPRRSTRWGQPWMPIPSLV